MASPILLVPGIGNSGPTHWQSLWQDALPNTSRLSVADWDHVACADWVAQLNRQVALLGPDTLIVAHSLGCLAVAHWAADADSLPCARGALLVAVPDPAAAIFPSADATGFAPLPMRRLPFPTIVVSSSDDPYSSVAHAHACANAWGDVLVDIGPRGHVNAASGLGHWPEGLQLLARFDALWR